MARTNADEARTQLRKFAPFDADKVLRVIAECPQAPARSGEPQAEVICVLAAKQAGEPSQGQEEISEGDLNNLEPRQLHLNNVESGSYRRMEMRDRMEIAWRCEIVWNQNKS